MKIAYTAVIVLLLAALTAPPLYATYPDGAYGKYSYSAETLDISIDWRADAIDVVLNGKTFRNVRSGADENKDNFGSNGVFPFDIIVEDSGGRTKMIHMSMLFNNDRVVKVGAIYFEREITNKTTGEGKVSKAKVVEMKFTPAVR